MTTEADEYKYWYSGGKDGPNDPTNQASTEERDGEKEVLDYVFVYGTLLSGQPNHNYFLQSSFFLGEGTTKDMFVMFGCGFPLARRPNENENYWFAGNIKGEIYGVTKHVLKQLDRLEGHPHFYERRITPIKEYPRKTIWMYHWANQHGRIEGELVTPDSTTKLLDWRKRVEQLKKAVNQ